MTGDNHSVPTDHSVRDEHPISNELLDLFGPVLFAPIVALLFWGSAPNYRVLGFAIAFAAFTAASGVALWIVARRASQHYELSEKLWSLSAGAIGATLPWVIAPETRWGHYALGLIFAAVMASDTLFIALRPNDRWKLVLLGNAASYAAFLVAVGAWPVALFCSLFSVHLMGGHDAVQNLVRGLRSERSKADQLARTDPLTGLLNRRGLSTYLDNARASGALHLAIVAIDIDNFKEINDRIGHHGGDLALMLVSNHLRDELGAEWLVARSGGDEFMCATTTGSLDNARRALRRIPSLEFESRIMPIRVSAGLVAGHSSDPLLEDASAALRLSKNRGKHRLTEVDDDLRGELRSNRRLRMELADAVQRKEIELWAQPIMRLDPNGHPEVHSYECLARWTTPDGDQVPPGVFIPMVEEQRLTRELGEHVITKAIEFLASLEPPVAVAVNVSASHFTGIGFAEFVHAAIARAGVDPTRLTIEITESERVVLDEISLTVARQLRAIGVGLAIDDFGTGYASLERLIHFPCTQLKLDRMLINNAAGSSLEHLLVGFGRIASHMEVVAEGVETTAQLAMLQRHGVPYAQGYLFAKPRPLVDIQREHLLLDDKIAATLRNARVAHQTPLPDPSLPRPRLVHGPLLSEVS